MRNLTRNGNQCLLSAIRTMTWNAIQERPRIGVGGRLQHGADRASLDEFARAHDANRFRDVGGQTEIARNVRCGHPSGFSRNPGDQPGDYRFDCRIAPGCRFTQDEQLRPQEKRHRSDHALQQATGERVRPPARSDSGFGSRTRSRTARISSPTHLFPKRPPSSGIRFVQLPADAHGWVQGGRGIPVCHRDGLGPKAAECDVPDLVDILAFHTHPAAREPAALREMALRRVGERGLSAAGFSGRAERRARTKCKTEPADDIVILAMGGA